MVARGLFSKWWIIALASLIAGGLVALFLPMNLALPSPSFVWFYSVIVSEWAVVLICAIMITVPWRPLDMDGVSDPVRLRQAGYEVTIRDGDFDLRVGKYSQVRIRLRDGKRSYRALPTPTGFGVIVFLCFTYYLIILAFPILLYIYIKTQRGLEEVPPNLRALPRPPEKGVDELVRDSLAGAYALARQTAEVRRSNFHDHVLILVTMALLGFVVLLMMSAQAPVDSSEFAWRIGPGSAALIVITIGGALVLRMYARKVVEKDERLAKELLAAMMGTMPEGGSAVEMLLRACSEVPRWLKAHRRGMWHRRPAMTLLIVLLLDQGAILLITSGVGSGTSRLIGGALLIGGILLLISQYLQGRRESDDLSNEWTSRMGELKSILGLGEER